MHSMKLNDKDIFYLNQCVLESYHKTRLEYPIQIAAESTRKLGAKKKKGARDWMGGHAEPLGDNRVIFNIVQL